MTTQQSKTSAELGQELTLIEARRADLQAQHAKAVTASEKISADFMAGRVDSSAAIKAASDVTAIEKLIEQVDWQISQTKSSLNEVVASEQRTEKIAHLAKLANEATVALNGYAWARAALAASLRENLDKMREERQRVLDARREFTSMANGMCGGAMSKLVSARNDDPIAEAEMNRLLATIEEEGADLDAVLIAGFGPGRTAADRDYRFEELGIDGRLADQAFNAFIRANAADLARPSRPVSPAVKHMVDKFLEEAA